MKQWVVMLYCFLFASCAGTIQYQQYPSLDPSNTPTAVIHVVRRNELCGCVIPAPVYVDRYLIGRIGPGGHITARVPVGNISVASTTSDAVLQTEPDTPYFVEVSTRQQIWLMTPPFNITVITRDRAREIMGDEAEL